MDRSYYTRRFSWLEIASSQVWTYSHCGKSPRRLLARNHPAACTLKGNTKRGCITLSHKSINVYQKLVLAHIHGIWSMIEEEETMQPTLDRSRASQGRSGKLKSWLNPIRLWNDFVEENWVPNSKRAIESRIPPITCPVARLLLRKLAPSFIVERGGSIPHTTARGVPLKFISNAWVTVLWTSVSVGTGL